VEILFRDDRLERCCRTKSSREQTWGTSARLVARRLFELSAMANFGDAALLPGVGLDPDSVAGRYRVRCMDGIELVLRPTLEGGAEPESGKDVRSLTTVIVDEVSVIPPKGGD
jgi:hypothetical protein